MSSESEAFVTLVTNDTYALGALVLAHSLRQSNTRAQLVALITPGVTEHMKNNLSSNFDLVSSVDLINSNDTEILEAMKRPELGVTLTKIHCWRLVQFKKCVFLDADTLVLSNVDELFEKEELSAVPDIGWPDCFNSGVFVFKPSEITFRALVKLAKESGSFDGGDQGLLNTYFCDWRSKDLSRILSFIYNMSSIAVYSYPPAFKQFGKNVKIVHFLGTSKPWLYAYSVTTGQVSQPKGIEGVQQLEFIQMWWNLFMSKVQPCLTEDDDSYENKSYKESGLAGSLSKITITNEYKGVEGPVVPDEFARQNAWERGQIDYLGSDSFVNIQKKIDDAINSQIAQ